MCGDTDKRMAVGTGLNISRRDWLRRIGWAAAAATVPGSLCLQAQEISPMMTTLSTYMSEARNRELPDHVLQETKHHILDTFAAMISGSELLPGRMAMKFAQSYGSTGACTVVASNILLGPIEAALVNGELAHSDETDDDYTGGGAHPGSAVIPATLAIGERVGISGQHFTRAVALGYDIGMRAFKTIGLDGSILKDTHILVGTVGSAAAAGCAFSLNAQQMRWLLDYAAQQGGAGVASWRRDTDHIEKGFVFGGGSARNGVNAAMDVQLGWTAVNDVMAGPDNLIVSYNPKADPNKFVEGLGERYEITLTTLKRWTTGGPIQSPLDALQMIIKDHPFQTDQVQKIIVHASPSAAYTVNNREMPDICLQHMVAVMIIDKTASFKAAHDKPRMQDPEILKVRAKVDLVAEPELEKLIPKRVAIVDVILKDGTKFSQRVDTVRGTPDNPMNREEVVAKARDLILPVMGKSKTDGLVDKLLNLEKVADIRELRPLLQKS
jgi:2-methylcitrate dehydratase PrpD